MTTSDQVIAAIQAAVLKERSEILALLRAEVQRADRLHKFEPAAWLRTIIAVVEKRPTGIAGQANGV